jgi:hypothetical protein
MKRTAPRTAPKVAPERTRQVVEGHVVDVHKDGRARVITTGGRSIDCRCARAVDLDWLRAAVAVAPVEAEISIGDGGRGSLWAVFSGPSHAAVKPARLSLQASEAITLTCGPSSITLAQDGRVRVRGKDVGARGSRVARLQGGTVRVN